MARARRSKQGEVKGDWTPIKPTLPDECPLCGVSSDEMLPHLQSHAPVEICQRCEAKEKGWRLDGDGATHFRTDIGLFYCSNCGRYAPIEVAPQD
jgi:transcription elongation factor Elf1